MLEVLVAPTIQPFDHKQTHDDLDWRPRATRRQNLFADGACQPMLTGMLL
jgi:hypothetical protein